jgi:1-acyl-sn-glycerol-3-phosphate acyltransferase
MISSQVVGTAAGARRRQERGGTVAQRGLGLWQRVAVALVLPVVTYWTRCRWTGERLPPTGGVIIAANHISHFDPLTLAHFVYRSGRWPRFLGKASLWRLPAIGFLLRKTQQIPVERGSVDAVKSLDALIAALDAGGAVIIYPEGTTTREPDLWPMRGKTGAGRSRCSTRVPRSWWSSPASRCRSPPGGRWTSAGGGAPHRPGTSSTR